MISEELNKTANAIIYYHREIYEESISPMKLQKLCYYAQGLYMAAYDGSVLFDDNFEAWTYGPVINNLYHKYKHYSWRTIQDDITLPEIEEDKLHIIRMAVEAYGRYDGASLVSMTNREEPWLLARKGLPETAGSRKIITKESIETYFKENIAVYEEEEEYA